METPARHRINELANDIGRLRKRTDPDSSAMHLVDRLTSHAEALHLLNTPSAGQLAAWYALTPDGVDAALETVDEWWQQLQGRLQKTLA